MWALGSYNGDLVAGGEFLHAGGVPAARVALWDGAAWHALGLGIAGHHVAAVAEYQGSLYVGGSFTGAGGAPAKNIARWNGSAWSALGAGIEGAGFTPCQALAVFNGDLYVGGHVSKAGGQTIYGIARWDGAAWSGVGSGLPPSPAIPEVRSLTVHEGALIAGGWFARAGTEACSGIARWDGAAWIALHDGTEHGANCVRSVGGELLAGGSFQGAEPAEFGLARWTGTAWERVGDTMSGSPVTMPITSRLEEYGGAAIVTPGPSGTGGAGIARWDGAAWSTLGDGWDGGPTELLAFGNQLLASGFFTRAAGVPARFLAVRDAAGAWREFGGGANAPAMFCQFRGDPIALGGFTEIGGQEILGAARWDGSVWHALDPPPGLGLGRATERDDALFFAAMAGAQLGLASWDGAAWEVVPGGVTSTKKGPTPNITQVATFRDSVIVAGAFEFAGGVPARNIASWDGTAWRALGGGLYLYNMTSFVECMLATPDTLYVSGRIFRAGSVDVNSIARWDGLQWRAMGDGFSGPVGQPSVYALAMHDGRLIAGGMMTHSGTVLVNGVAQWDGTAWSGLGGGVTGAVLPRVLALASAAGRLAVGGDFAQAGTVVSPGYAEWTCACYADCDGDGVLTLSDFGCFQTRFALGNMQADCNHDALLNLADFGCFQTKFALGCP